ncbi:MAG: esterase/lipase family protein [Opitutales bacterium]
MTAPASDWPEAEGVILLHGLGRTRACMVRMERALTETGYWVENIDYPSRTAPIAQLADEAIGRVLTSPRMQACTRVHFVTHSLGGILVRSYCSRHRIERLGRVVMLGPPNRGSEVVDHLRKWRFFLKLYGPAGSELGTGADSTPNKLGPVDFELGVIAGNRSINWINSLMIAGPDDGKVSLERTKVVGMKAWLVVPVTHPFLMSNRRVIASTRRFLATGEFSGQWADTPTSRTVDVRSES